MNLQKKLDFQFKLEESSDMSWPILFKIFRPIFSVTVTAFEALANLRNAELKKWYI